MSDPILSITSYAATGLSIAAGATAAVTLAIGLFVFARSRRTRVAISFLMLAVAAAASLLGASLTHGAPERDVALFWARSTQLPMVLLAAAAFQLAGTVAGWNRLRKRLAIAVWVAAASFGVTAATSSTVIRDVGHRPWGFQPLGGAGVVALLLLSAAVWGGAIALLWTAFRRSEGKASDRAGLLLVAMLLGAAGFLDVLPALGIEAYPVSWVATLAFVTVAGVAVGGHRLVPLTPQYAASQILETMKSAVILVDMAGIIRVANRATTHLLGYAAADLVGRPMRIIFDPNENTSTRRILNSTGVLEQLMGWTHVAGHRVDVLTSSSFIRAADGAPIGVVYVASDYTERKRAEQALRESEQRYRKLFDANPLPMWVYDFQTLRFVAVNDAAINHYGYSREEFLGMRITEIRPQEDVPEILALLPILPERGGPSIFRHMKKDGSVIHVEISSFEFFLDAARMRLVIAHDVTERRNAEQRLRESEARYRLLFERNLAGVYRMTVDGRVLDCNDAFARIFAYESREEVLRHGARSLYFEDADRERLMDLLREQKVLTNHEARMRRKDDRLVWVLENMTLLDSGTGEPALIEGTVIDITDRKYAQEQVEYQAYHDSLTGLPNRLLFRDRLQVALAQARRNTRVLAVMFLDLDEFKVVNDTLGHTVGDRLLQAIASRLVGAVRAEDTVARMGGDEFTILLPDVGDGRGASTVARKVLEGVSAPVRIDDHVLHVTPSVGIALFPGDGFDAETLLKSADRAMYRAKQFGRNNYQYATPPPFDDRFSLQRRLGEALQGGEFSLHYQPIVDLITGEITAVEALLRWNDPQHGLLLPESFIGAAEDAELTVPLGEWVLRTACAQIRRWRDAGAARLRVAVNLSPRHFQQPGLTDVIVRVLRESGVPPAALDVEITEAAIMSNPEGSLQTIRALHEAGVGVSIDDFGTGYSSFRYLRKMPIDAVKIDHEFVRSFPDPADRAALSAVISMARPLGLRVVAEGVETPEQLEFLREEGCAEMQGFLHARPMPAGELEPLLFGRKPSPATDQATVPDARG